MIKTIFIVTFTIIFIIILLIIPSTETTENQGSAIYRPAEQELINKAIHIPALDTCDITEKEAERVYNERAKTMEYLKGEWINIGKRQALEQFISIVDKMDKELKDQEKRIKKLKN